MEEKIIIEGKMFHWKRFRNTVIPSFLGLAAIFFIISRVALNVCRDIWDKMKLVSFHSYEYQMLRSKRLIVFNIYDVCYYAIFIALGIALILLIYYIIYHKTSLTVTDKRVFGKAAFGKQVDLPLDSISAIGTGVFKSIAVATSSGRIKFFWVKNRDEVHRELSNLLLKRQSSKVESAKVVVEKAASNDMASELKSIKELLDSGIISQEEFDAKKKQLLGL